MGSCFSSIEILDADVRCILLGTVEISHVALDIPSKINCFARNQEMTRGRKNTSHRLRIICDHHQCFYLDVLEGWDDLYCLSRQV